MTRSESDPPKKEAPYDAVRELPPLLGAVAVFVLVVSAISSAVLGLVPAALRAAAPYSCPAGTLRTETHGQTETVQNQNRPNAAPTTRWREQLVCIDAAGNRQDADDLTTMVVLAVPGLLLAIVMIVGFIVWAARRGRRSPQGS